MKNNTVKSFLAGFVVCLAILPSFAAPKFQSALPVWPEGRTTRMNDFVEFRASFEAKAGEKPILRVTGSSVYRIRLNGEFAGYGPARAAKGFFRVDEWPLAAREGRNDLSIEVSAYNCNNYYIAEWPGFLQAEVVVGDRVLAMTGCDFGARETPRVTKCSRYSFQRGFGEAYKLALGWKGEPLTLAVQPAVPLVERIAPLPDFPVTKLGAPIAATKVRRKDEIKYRPIRSVDNPDPTFKLYEANTLDMNIWKELQHVEVRQSAAVAGRPPYQGALPDGNGFVFDVGFNESGFPGLTVSCTKPGRLWMAFDEILQDGNVNPLRYGVANGVVWDLQPGRYRLEAFEPYTFRYLHVFALGGDFQIEDPYVRGYKNPDAKKAKFKSSDPALDKIFDAARETFAQNAVDVFTDCPSRERAGWLCDSFFTGRSSLLFTGSAELERLFIQNYLLPKSFPDLPDGALPMCYPADHPNHNFIPNWTMWLVIEIDEYLRRSGDRATVDAMKPRLVKLIGYLKTFRNSDGLLEKLPAWVFVEWSEANKLVQDVNYPSNMTWAEVLDCMDRLYGMPELAAEARKVRETVRKQSWTGRWFCDNAKRQQDGSLKLSGKCTETCQYYAFMFGTATPELYPELWKTLLADFGPKRKETKKHPEIYFSNAFIGNYLRLELLSRAGLGRQLLDETKGYFSFMAERTGTLWENDTPHASCNHGFASHAAVFYVKNVLGVDAVDLRAKTVTVQPTDVPLASCSATLPVPGGAIKYGWTKKGGKLEEKFSAPDGWRIVRKVVADTSADRVKTPLAVRMKRVGTIRPRAASQIKDSNWTLGCEVLDRDFANFEEYKRFVEPLGIKTIRLQGGWAKCERVKGKYDFAWLDRIVDYARAKGLNVLLETDYGNPVYEGGGGWDLAGGFPTSEEGLAGWDAWVDALTKHFKGRVRDWAMWNEPDIGKPAKTPESIAAFNVRTAKIVKRNIPDARIAGLSLARNKPEYLEDCLRLMGEDVKLFDWIIYHGYAPAPEMSYENVEAQKEVLAKYNPNAKMRQGENGCPSEMATRFALSRIPWSEYSQAKWDMRRMLGDLGHDVESSVFTICDFNHTGREINLKGLLRANENKEVIAVKRAYYAVQNVVSVFDNTLTRVKDSTFGTKDMTLSTYEYRKPDGRPVFVFWTHAEEVVKTDKAKGVLGEGEFTVKYLRPGDSFAMRPAMFKYAGAPLKDPVWVDLLTGRIYAFPKKDMLVHSNGITFVNVPVYDSPCLLTERSIVVP